MQDWERYKASYLEVPELGMGFDFSRMGPVLGDFDTLESRFEAVFEGMNALEKGAIANPDEKREVGHYWLRAPELAPNPGYAEAIRETVAAIRAFSKEIQAGSIQGQNGSFRHVLVIGIGGSALGPQFVSRALAASDQAQMLAIHFFDNTDPAGMETVLHALEGQLGQTLAVVISKSGGTKETRNGMLEAQAAYQRNELDFAKHAVAITGEGSQLDQVAESQGWLKRFAMWDWVGGRTSELSAVGLLPAALQGIDIEGMLEGARLMDRATRNNSLRKNPAAMMAALWYLVGNGKGEKNMVVVPYKDRLSLFAMYLQQLVMESLGKAQNLKGETVEQGISVFGNKGSTDQHAYIQQLRDGRNDFFATFIQVLEDRLGPDLFVEEGVTSGDYLLGFLIGTQEALTRNGRASMNLVLPRVSPQTVGALIAVFERAVGFYASLIGINAYHQPGVEAGKVVAGQVIELQRALLAKLAADPGQSWTAEALAAEMPSEASVELVFRICEHLAANRPETVKRVAGSDRFSVQFQGC